MTAFSLALRPRTLRFAAVTTSHEDTQFDATDEAFFNAPYDDGAVSERPVTLDVEEQGRETDEGLPDPVESERLRARRARLNQTVVEIVSTLALMSSMAFGMELARGSAASSERAVAQSSPI
jgi:hypothetical protein